MARRVVIMGTIRMGRDSNVNKISHINWAKEQLNHYKKVHGKMCVQIALYEQKFYL